jgi:hypothetical protein
MPQLIPTPAEFERLTASQKARIRRVVLGIVMEADRVAQRAYNRERETRAWAEDVRQSARALSAYMPTEDPATIAERRRILLGKD